MIKYTTLGNLIAPAKVIRCGKGSFPVLSMTMHDGIVLQSERFKKSLASIDQSDYKVVKRGQLVVGFPIDEGVLYVQKAADEGIMSPAYNVWDIDTEKVDADFLELCLHSPQSMQYYKDKLRGTTARRRSIPTSDLLALKIRLPDMQTQREAVAIIRKVEAILNARQAQLDYFEQLVKSRFIELFASVEDEDTLINLCSFIDYRGKTPEKAESGLPFITAKNVKMHHMSFDTQEFISKETYDKVMTRGFPRIGDVVFTTEAPLGNVCRIPHIETEFYIGQRIITMQTEQLEPAYLEYALSSDEFKRKIAEKSSGSTVTGIRSKLLEKLSIPVPPRALQKQFAAFVQQTDKSKLAVQKGLQELEILKKSLMQQYFG